MQPIPLRTTVIGSYPFPAWLEFCSRHLAEFGPADLREMQDDAVSAALHDQIAAGLDVVSDGEQTRLDFNLGFYGCLEGIERESLPERRFGPPAHDQRGRHLISGELRAPRGLGVVEEFQRLRRLAPQGPALKASVPGPYTLSGRLAPGGAYPDRWAVAEALFPIVRTELEQLAAAGCTEITVDEPSMSCYAWCEDTSRMVELFNRTVAPLRDTEPHPPSGTPPPVEASRGQSGVSRRSDTPESHRDTEPHPPSGTPLPVEAREPLLGLRGQAGVSRPPTAPRVRLSTHLCFGNYKARAVAPRRYAPMFPAFLELQVDEIHLEMASREFAEIEIIQVIAEKRDVSVGIIDVKSYYIEAVEEVAARVRRCLEFAPPERLSFAPDCGFSQTARWAARQKLENMVRGVRRVRAAPGHA
jgi:methionine synthase II (cobalamin-independent)